MMRRLGAALLASAAALAACSSDSDPVEPTTQSDEQSVDGHETAGEDGVMSVEDGVATSTDGRLTFPVLDGWQAYPAPLDPRVNITVLLISDVNNAEFAANVVGTWADPVPGVPSSYEEWEAESGNVFTGDGVTVEDAAPIEIGGQTVKGLQVERSLDGITVKQLVYPIFTDEGMQELAFSASPDVFDENVDDVIDMFTQMELNF